MRDILLDIRGMFFCPSFESLHVVQENRISREARVEESFGRLLGCSFGYCREGSTW